MLQFLLNGSDTARIFTLDHICDFFWEFQTLFLNNFVILDDIDRDIVIDESENVKINDVNRTLNLHNIFLSHFVASCIFDDCDTAIQLVQAKVVIDIHAFSCLNMV